MAAQTRPRYHTPTSWMSAADDDTDTDGSTDADSHGCGNDDGDRGHYRQPTDDAVSDATRTSPAIQSQPGGSFSQQQSQNADRSLQHPDGSTPRTITITNLFANRTELEALRRPFTQEPNWIATMIENESWDGTAEENATKWQGLRVLELME
jgi:hypothetical protein